MKWLKMCAGIVLLVSHCGCMAAAVGYLGYKLADAKENETRIQAQVEREKLQLEREKAGLGQ